MATEKGLTELTSDSSFAFARRVRTGKIYDIIIHGITSANEVAQI